ncbi:nitroreductase [Sphingomonas sanguinis]|uniref:nitroreductase n=1 Tax=Sphingomonas sp. LC-1 TaxID=3110957 RepID=UPI0021BAA9A4|nr:nitroreductase [Sphingomonas sp. LC-1]MCT8001986.1 nitroreductase [Sphingomonas sp. LC-1]
MNVAEAVTSRRSIRAFTDEPVSLETLRRVLDRARWAPSGCNFQPWQATVLTGEPLKRLQAKMLASEPQDPIEYSFSEPQQSPRHLARLQAVGAAMYGALGIAREDRAARDDQSRQQLLSFGAPALLVCYLERFHTAPQWSDMGMWLQTIMLLLREEGLDSCPQEWMALYARLIKEEIGVSDTDFILFCGLAIGHRAPDLPINRFDRERVPLDEQVRFVGFDQNPA